MSAIPQADWLDSKAFPVVVTKSPIVERFWHDHPAVQLRPRLDSVNLHFGSDLGFDIVSRPAAAPLFKSRLAEQSV